jgi:DNA-binding NarL/FixJ family response regulator
MSVRGGTGEDSGVGGVLVPGGLLERDLELARIDGILTSARVGPGRPLITGLEALTPSERRVDELLAAGLSNPETVQALFVTLNTVENHPRHTYQRLAISSRAQLPAA